MKPKVSPHHKTHSDLHLMLSKAKEKVTIGGIYSHYKHPENTYKVINLGITEADDQICVIYQATYDDQLVFVRPIDSWLETPEWNGQKVERFKLISPK